MIHQESGRQQPPTRVTIDHRLKNRSHLMDPTDTPQFARMAKAIEYLYDHAAEQPDLAEVAALVHLSPAHLQREFQAWAGISPKKMLQYISASRAKAALKRHESVTEAALAGGLSGSGRLHDLLVNIEGMTPGEYKNGGAGLRMAYHFAESPFGELLIAATLKGVCWMAFADERSTALQALQEEYPQADWVEEENDFHRQAMQVFRGSDGTRVSLHLKGTPFQLKVWQALLNIPAGCLKSYGGLAAELGTPKAARAVGSAVGRNPVAVLIPCHRVIRESGVIGGYRWQRGRKMALLAHELGDTE